MTKNQAREVIKDEIEVILGSIAMPTTGNNEQDQAYLEDHAVSKAMIAANFCPNGCGEMSKNECLKCNFTHYTSTF